MSLTIMPPTGGMAEHVLEPTEHVPVIGAARGRLPARLGRDTVLLPVAVCARVAALAK